MVKADGCVAIHADGGAYKPLNWMNAPNTLVDHGDHWTVTNPKGEELTIRLLEVLTETAHERLATLATQRAESARALIAARQVVAVSSGVARWLESEGRWNMFSKAHPPIAWQPFPTHPNKGTAQ